MRNGKKWMALCLAAALTAGLAGCQSQTGSSAATAAENKNVAEQNEKKQMDTVEESSVQAAETHKIGVAVYNLEDD